MWHMSTRNVAGIAIPAVGVREFRADYRKIVDKTNKTRQPFALLNRETVEAVVVPAEVYEGLVSARDALERLRQSMPLLLQAAAANVSIPSKTLEVLGMGSKFDWRKLNAFQAASGLAPTHSEDGAALASAKHVPSQSIRELDDDLTYAD
jgi:PHD/YefM family antitoxin component YafN of YafNO toxin-antitoxin module